MSDRIIQGFSEMKDIYLTQILTEEKEEEGEDYDKDGKKERPKKEWKDSRNNKIRAAMGKPPEDDYEEDEDKEEEEKPKSKKGKKKEKDDDMKTESFSNWRTDLYEVISKLEPKVKDIGNEQIVEKPVNNKITLNPTVTEKFAVIDTQELSEEFIVETSNVAAEYFVRKGLNEHGLEMVIDYLGEEKFLEYVFYVAEDSLLTEATKSKRTPAELKALEAKRKALNAESKRKHEEAKASIAKKVSVDKGNTAVKSAVQQQNPKAPAGIKGIAQRVQTIWKEGEGARTKGWEKHDAAAKKLNTAAGEAHRKYKEGIKQGKTPFQALGSLFASFEDWVGGLIDEGYDLSTISASQLVERYNFLLEKATSEQQQKIFGLALSVKRGEVSRSKVSDRVLEIVDGMSEAEIRKFASTKHKGLPHKKEE